MLVEGRDFPVTTCRADRASLQDLLPAVGGPDLQERQLRRLVREFPGACISGGAEQLRDLYREEHRGPGGQRWSDPALSGYIIPGGAAVLAGKSRPWVYREIKQERLVAVSVQGRTLVSIASLQLHPAYTSNETTVTVLYRDGGTSSNPLVGPYIIEPDDYFE